MRSRRGFIGAAVGAFGLLAGCSALESNDSNGSSGSITVRSYDASVDDLGILDVTVSVENTGSGSASETVVAEASGEDVREQSISRSLVLDGGEETNLSFTFEVDDPGDGSSADYNLDIYVE